MEVTSTDEMIAINSDRSEFVSLSGSEVHACTKMGIQFLCPFVSLASQSQPKDCLKAIFLGDAKTMEMSCQIRFLQDQFIMRRVNDTAFLVYASSEVVISITCKLNTQLLKVNNMLIVDINPGCTAFANGFTFLSAIQPVSRIQHVVSVFPSEFLMNLNLTEDLVNSTLDGYESVDIRSLEKRSK